MQTMTEILLWEKFQQLPEPSQQAVLQFIDSLLRKRGGGDDVATKTSKSRKNGKKTFSAVRLDTRGFKFNREEANER